MSVRDRLRQRLAAERDDSGSALVLALLTVLLVGAVLAAVLQYQGTGFTLAPRMQQDRNEANYLQGSVEGAINSVRGSSDSGRVGSTCPSFSPTAPSGLSGVSGKTFRVDCEAKSSPLGSGADDAPRYAIHTLGTASGEGIAITGNNPLFVNGPVYSNGVVTVDNQTQNLLRVNGTLNAVGSCTGKILTTDTLGTRCSPPSGAAGDPGYTHAVASQSALDGVIATGSEATGADPIPTCSSGGSTATFSPAYFGVLPATLVAKSACPTATLWSFPSGTYVFDYAGNWEVKGYQVVGGTLAAGHNATKDLGAACTSTGGGARFVFQGAGTMTTQSSSGSTVSGIELCGPTTSSGTPPQRIVLSGIGSGTTSTTAESSTPATVVSATSDPVAAPSGQWSNVTGARTIDVTGLATSTGIAKNATRSLAYTVPSSVVPKGAKVTKVEVRVAHAVTSADVDLLVQSTAVPSLAITKSVSDACVSATPCVVDLTSDLASASDVTWRLLRSMTVTWTADAKQNGATATVDGLDVRVTYTSPTFRRQTAADPFFDSTNNPNVFMHGTVYTPDAKWAVQVHNTGRSIFDRGVVVRTIDIKVGASTKQTDSPFQLPQGSPGGRYVLFRGYVGTTERVRACVLFTDSAPTPTGGTTAYFGYGAEVRHWLWMRSTSTGGAAC